MPDITACPGGECPLKDRCYRFMLVPVEMQPALVNPPYEGSECVLFYPVRKGHRLRVIDNDSGLLV